MFIVKAGYSSEIELRSGMDAARAFFADVSNFVRHMPGIAQIHKDAGGIAHWRIEADIPLVGRMLQQFAVELAEDTPERIEWAPAHGEKQNFLRYSADFVEKAKGVTQVYFSQMVELRRSSARELHLLAGLAGESLIGSEMTKKIREMIRIFIEKAKEHLESVPPAAAREP